MKAPLFTGTGVAIVTPFSGTDINFKEFGKIVDFQLANGCQAIIVCGTTGEKSTLSDKEHKALVCDCIEHVAGRVPVIAGTGSNDTAYALQNSIFAAREGASGVLSVTPYYNKTSQEGLVRHFETIADGCDCPLILYNVPSRTGMTITTDTYARLAKHPNINGTKEASGDFHLISSVIATCGEDMHVWSGNDDQIVPMMSLGAKGVISVFSNLMPAETRAMTDACQQGDFKKAAALQLAYFRLIDLLFCDVNPIPIKAAMAMIGFDTEQLRLPLYPLSEKNRGLLTQAIEDVRQLS